MMMVSSWLPRSLSWLPSRSMTVAMDDLGDVGLGERALTPLESSNSKMNGSDTKRAGDIIVLLPEESAR